MGQYTKQEKLDMVLVYGECKRNAWQAKSVYAQRYPDRRRKPDHKTILNLCRNLVNFGAFEKPKRERSKTVTNDFNVALVLQQIIDNPRMSLRELKRNTNISISSTRRILKQNKYHPYKTKLVHKLEPGDPERRINFLARFDYLFYRDENIFKKILWSDESRFHNNGVVNRHNSRYWTDNNPRWITERGNQRVFGINVWCGILNGYLIGPHFYEGTLNGDRYLSFLQRILPPLLEDVPIETRRNIIFQQDGAPPHNAQIVTDYLNVLYPNRWIGTNGPMQWPARSPDLTPLDFFLWAHLKDTVYAEPIEDMADLQNKIIASCAAINRRILLRTADFELRRRYDCCVRASGENFEQML